MSVVFAFLLLNWEPINQEGLAAQRAGRYREARDLFAQALDQADSAARAKILNNLAATEYLSGALAEAELHYQQAIGMARDQGDLAKAHNNLALLYRQQARFGPAGEHVRMSLGIEASASAFHNLAEIHRMQGRYQEAEEALGRAEALPRDNTVRAQLLQCRASLYQERNLPALAEPLLRQAVSLLGQDLGPEHPLTLGALNNLAQSLLAANQRREAERILVGMLETMKRSLGPNHPRVAAASNNLAQLYRLEHRASDAEPLFRSALRIWESTLGPSHPDTAKALLNLGGLFFEQGKIRGAEQFYTRALGIAEKSLGPAHPLTRETLTRLERLYAVSKRPSAAARIRRRLDASKTLLPDAS